MAEWHVSGSESEGEGTEGSGIEVGRLRIPPFRVAELLQRIEKRKTLDLECLASSSRPSRERRTKHKKHKKRNDSSATAANSKNQEEVSETASELRSTTSTDTREGKWNNVSHFDYFHEDSTSTDLTTHKRQRKLPPGNREKKLASLDQIVSDVKQQKERTQDQSNTPEITLPYNHHFHNSTHHASTYSPAQNSTSHWGAVTTAGASPALSFGFDDDSDLDSPSGGDSMKMSVLSQINRVEKLLDDEGLT